MKQYRCIKCNEMKPVSEFVLHKSYSNPLVCKSCYNERHNNRQHKKYSRAAQRARDKLIQLYQQDYFELLQQELAVEEECIAEYVRTQLVGVYVRKEKRNAK